VSFPTTVIVKVPTSCCEGDPEKVID